MKLYRAGSRFAVFLWEEENGTCPVLDYLNALWDAGQGRDDAADTLNRYLENFPDHGPPVGHERCHYLRDEKIFEMKAHAGGGHRMYAFYHPGQARTVVVTHCSPKPSGDAAYGPEADRARAVLVQLTPPPEPKKNKRPTAKPKSSRKDKK